MSSTTFRQVQFLRPLGERRGMPRAGGPGLDLVHPRCLSPQHTSFDLRQAAGGAKLPDEVAMRLKVQ
jgi:hypothetical protein